ncbi:MAG TPA: TadE/TadG family type IV pilus assembly protein [Candidatus Binataceae bacterium]|nr:TadE/TadG family type IV pilus assembly protein [Candidatus Binataceae bacterium]
MRVQLGQSVVEFSLIAAVTMTLLLAASDFSRMFFTSIAVNDAARAGAQYGSQNLVTAADIAGMESAATTDGTNISGLSATASQCTCGTSTTVAACASNYCTNNPGATYVTVNTRATFTTFVTYPGIPSSTTLTGQAIMQVQQ